MDFVVAMLDASTQRLLTSVPSKRGLVQRNDKERARQLYIDGKKRRALAAASKGSVLVGKRGLIGARPNERDMAMVR